MELARERGRGGGGRFGRSPPRGGRGRSPIRRGNPPGRKTNYRIIVENLSSRTSWQVSLTSMVQKCAPLMPPDDIDQLYTTSHNRSFKMAASGPPNQRPVVTGWELGPVSQPLPHFARNFGITRWKRECRNDARRFLAFWGLEKMGHYDSTQCGWKGEWLGTRSYFTHKSSQVWPKLLRVLHQVIQVLGGQIQG